MVDGAEDEDTDMFAQAAFASPPPCVKRGLCPCCHNYLCDGEGHGGRAKDTNYIASIPSVPSSAAATACFEALDDDSLLTIARLCGRKLTTFASINATCRRLATTPSVWKQAYNESSHDDVDDWGDLPESMWRSCLVHSTAKHAREKSHVRSPT